MSLPQIIDTESDPGSYAYVLRYARPSFLRVEPFPIPAPRLSTADNPGGCEAQPASLVASACGCPVNHICAPKAGNGAFQEKD